MSMTNWKKMLDNNIQMAIKEKSIANGPDLSAKPRFIIVIMNYERLAKSRPLNLDLYDGTRDPRNHVQFFKSQIIFLGASDEMMCRSFLLMFRNTA